MSSKNMKTCEQLILSFEGKSTEEEFQVPNLSKLNEF